MTKVLVSDPIDQAGIDILTQVAQVDQKVGLSIDELKNIIGDYDGLMIRSGTQVTSDITSDGTWVPERIINPSYSPIIFFNWSSERPTFRSTWAT